MWRITFLLLLPLLCEGRLPHTHNGEVPQSNYENKTLPVEEHPEQDSERPQPAARIIGGDISERGVLPYIVNLDIIAGSSRFICGGSILRQRWIITAAHCVVRDVEFDPEECTNCVLTSTLFHPSQVEAFAGDLRLRDYDEGEQSSKAQMIVVHPEYDSNSLENDVALIRLQYPLEYSTYVQNIEVGDNIPPAGSPVTCGGWGVMEQGSVSYYLRQITYDAVSQVNCAARWKWYIYPGMWCSGGDPTERSATGDSGGPLVYHNSSTPTLVGLVSWGLPEPSNGDYDVNTDVPFYKSWIEDMMEGTHEDVILVSGHFQSHAWTSNSHAYQFSLVSLQCSEPGCVVECQLLESNFDRDSHVEMNFIDGSSVSGTTLETVTTSRRGSPFIRSTGQEMQITVSTSNLKALVNYTIQYRAYDELTCLGSAQKCDEVNDCLSMSDEIGCDYSHSSSPSKTAAGCYPGDFDCGDGMCVRVDRLCDGYYDCKSDLDEASATCGAERTRCGLSFLFSMILFAFVLTV